MATSASQTKTPEVARRTRRMILSGTAPAPALLAACTFPANAQEGPETAPAEPAPGAPETPVASLEGAPAEGSAPEVLAATPECADDDDVTPAQTEGPYFTPNSPERASLIESGMRGTRLMVTGRVLSTTCEPVARALIDWWQADDGGAYDNRGYRLRGHQFTDAQGSYRLETIVPGLYPGRTRHIHVKVQAPNQRVLTTQLYFPGEPGNRRDGIYSPELELEMREDANGKVGLFDFVLRVV
jgi:protocatechuate 3,4-dioxygenase beta subunit